MQNVRMSILLLATPIFPVTSSKDYVTVNGQDSYYALCTANNGR